MTDKVTSKTAAQKKDGFFNVLRMPSTSAPNKKVQKAERPIICREDISKDDRDAIIKLYDALVIDDRSKTVNITMIVEEAFPVFEEILGSANFKKLKKYFGIGCKPSKVGIKEQEISGMLDRLRTVENAQYYIDGYKELLEYVAAKLYNAPEQMTMLEKAKFVRMFHTIFVGFYFFAQDFRRTFNFQRNIYYLDVNFQAAIANNPHPFHPEELFTISRILMENFKENDLVFDLVYLELMSLDKKVQKEVLHFAELRLTEDGKLVSVNEAPRYQTFSSVRSIKNKVHPEIGVYPMELFAYKERISDFNFDDLYQLYKYVSIFPLSSFKTFTKKESYLEGAREVLKDRVYYEIKDECAISGQAEIDRIIRMVEYLAGIGYELNTSEGKCCNMGVYMPVFNFLHKMGYVDITIDPKKEFELAELLIARDTTGAIASYKICEIDEKELKRRLRINAKFEKEHFGIVTDATPEEIAIDFALDNGYVADEESISHDLISKIILPGNEENFKKFWAMEIDADTLKARIGFEEAFAEMYFDLRKVDVAAIESKLQDLKRGLAKKGEMKRWTLLINLYCYLVEEQVPCGPKNKAPKRNKGLKPENLKAQIA